MEIIKDILIKSKKSKDKIVNCYNYYCKANNIRYALKYYIDIDSKYNNNDFAFMYDENLKNEKNTEIIENNTNKIIELAFTDYNDNDLNKIKKDIINKFNNSNILLYIAFINYENKNFMNIDDICENCINQLIQFLNNELYDLNLNIKLYKHSYYNNTLEYITLGKTKITEVLLPDDKENIIPPYSNFRLSFLLDKLIDKQSIISLLQNKYNLDINSFCANCNFEDWEPKFCSNCKTKENINKYIKCINLLDKLIP